LDDDGSELISASLTSTSPGAAGDGTTVAVAGDRGVSTTGGADGLGSATAGGGVGVATAGGTGVGAVGGGPAVVGGAGTGIGAGVGAGAGTVAAGGAGRAGSNPRGSTYPSASALRRMPRWTLGTSCSGSPLEPMSPTTAPSATVSPFATPTEPRWTSVTEYPSAVEIVTPRPCVGTEPAKVTVPDAGARTDDPSGPPMSTPRCWPPA